MVMSYLKINKNSSRSSKKEKDREASKNIEDQGDLYGGGGQVAW